MFSNLLSCLDVEIDSADMAEIQKKLGLVYQGLPYIKYEIVLRQMQYDNHTERWTVKKHNDDGDTLSVIAEKTGLGGMRRKGVRQSYDAFQKSKQTANVLQRESLRKALRTSQQVLSTDALKNFDKSTVGR